MKSNFIGRKSEMAALFELWDKRTSSLVVCRGRRRIGKSTLIEEFASRSGCRFIEISDSLEYNPNTLPLEEPRPGSIVKVVE